MDKMIRNYNLKGIIGEEMHKEIEKALLKDFHNVEEEYKKHIGIMDNEFQKDLKDYIQKCNNHIEIEEEKKMKEEKQRMLKKQFEVDSEEFTKLNKIPKKDTLKKEKTNIDKGSTDKEKTNIDIVVPGNEKFSIETIEKLEIKLVKKYLPTNRYYREMMLVDDAYRFKYNYPVRKIGMLPRKDTFALLLENNYYNIINWIKYGNSTIDKLEWFMIPFEDIAYVSNSNNTSFDYDTVYKKHRGKIYPINVKLLSRVFHITPYEVFCSFSMSI